MFYLFFYFLRLFIFHVYACTQLFVRARQRFVTVALLNFVTPTVVLSVAITDTHLDPTAQHTLHGKNACECVRVDVCNLYHPDVFTRVCASECVGVCVPQ